MAWALQFDGVNDEAQFATPNSYHQNLTQYRFYAECIRDNSSSAYFVGRGGASSGFESSIRLLDTSVRVRYGGTSVTFSGLSVPISASVLTVEITRNGNTHELFINGISQGTVSNSATSTSTVLTIGRAGSDFSQFDLLLMELYDSPSGGALISAYDATASSHASGTPVLTDTGTAGNDATGVNMPTDGSAWVNLGGSGISVTALLNSNYMIEYNMKKNVASQSIGAQMITISDGSNFTGSVAVEVTIDGGTKTTGGGSVTHEGEGYHSYALTQAETNGNHIAVSFAGTGALTQTIQVYTSFPQTVDNDTKISLIPTTAMRGTDSANTVVPPSVAQFNARTIVSADYFLVTDYTAPDNASITSILADTNELQTSQGNWLTATGFSTSAEIAALNDISVTDILTTQMTESYAGDGTAPTLAQSLFLTMQNLQDFSYAGTTQTVKRLDGSTTAATYTLNDAVTPTSKTRAS